MRPRSSQALQSRACQPATCLRCIKGWLDRVAALEAARITGTFAPPDSAERAAALRDGLDMHARLRARSRALCAPEPAKKSSSTAAWN